MAAELEVSVELVPATSDLTVFNAGCRSFVLLYVVSRSINVGVGDLKRLKGASLSLTFWSVCKLACAVAIAAVMAVSMLACFALTCVI
jgi:hypothetical protein